MANVEKTQPFDGVQEDKANTRPFKGVDDQKVQVDPPFDGVDSEPPEAVEGSPFKGVQ